MIASYIKSIREQFEEQLKELVEIPTVSADPGHRRDIVRAADVAEKYCAIFFLATEFDFTR